MLNFKLRPWDISDLESLVENANNFLIAKNLTDGFPHPYTMENGRAFIKMANKDTPVRIFAIEINGRAVGAIGVHPQQDIMKKNMELGYWLGEKYWGGGVMTKAVQQVVQFAFDTFDITRIYARPFGPNIASQRVLENSGFSLEAHIIKNIFKNGEFLDEMIYAIRRKEV